MPKINNVSVLLTQVETFLQQSPEIAAGVVAGHRMCRVPQERAAIFIRNGVAQVVHAHVPQACLAARAGHSAYFDKPEQVNRLVIDFIARRARY